MAKDYAAEFVGPVEKNPRDSIAMFAVTSGNQIRALAQKFKEEGDSLNLMLFRHWQLRLQRVLLNTFTKK